jgi:cytochrome oxidase Cu insertion factor (SCO1/SenC/PrrC family)
MVCNLLQAQDVGDLPSVTVCHFGSCTRFQFHAKFSGVTSTTAQVDAITRQMGAFYSIHPGKSEESYLVSHNSAIFLVDPRGRLYGRFPPPLAPREIAEIFEKIRAFYVEREDKRWAFF